MSWGARTLAVSFNAKSPFITYPTLTNSNRDVGALDKEGQESDQSESELHIWVGCVGRKIDLWEASLTPPVVLYGEVNWYESAPRIG